jgi:hypothetical protein
MPLLMLAVALVPLSAEAQRAQCVTPRARCWGSPGQPQGSPCRCPSDPSAWGTTASDEFFYAPEVRANQRSLPRLRNDDLFDGDDVLAGPRHHRPQRPDPDDRE